jgi:hypothetical protein
VVTSTPESGYYGFIIVMCMVILLCTAAGCIKFGAMELGSGQAGPGGAGSGSGDSSAGGSGSGSGGGGGYGGGGGPGGGGGLPPGGGEIPLSDLKTTTMYTYFTVNCHSHDQSATGRGKVDSIDDNTITGEIPIEIIMQYYEGKNIRDNYLSTGSDLNLRYTHQKFCPSDDPFLDCKPCKETYEGPASGSVYIERAPSGGATAWVATFYLGGPSTYNLFCSGFDPKGIYCPPRYISYSDTGELRKATPPVQSSCNPDASPDLLLEAISAVECSITDAPFVLRDGEVITQKWKNDIAEDSYQSVDATYTFHISAR